MRRNCSATLISQPNIFPFLHVVIVVLIILMVNTPMMCKCVNIEVPRVLHARAIPAVLREDSILVAVERDGKIYFDTEQIAPDQFILRQRRAIRHSGEQRLYIKADASARYKLVKDLLDQVPFYLANRITFVTDTPRQD